MDTNNIIVKKIPAKAGILKNYLLYNGLLFLALKFGLGCLRGAGPLC
jgi:hypothetical protein